MSSHPNAILIAILKPDDLSRKTMRNILSEYSGGKDIEYADIIIGVDRYHPRIMESDYDGDFQIAADEGDLVFDNLVTYGYGEKILWEDLVVKKLALDEWVNEVCEKFFCTSKIYISANYW
jgi:hypothetical protein